MSLPGWESIESAGAIAKFFHIAGLVAIVLLALFEVVAYVYDHHKDVLVAAAAAAEVSARATHDAESQRELDAARGEIGTAHKEAHDAHEEVGKMKEAALPRHLTDQQKADIAKFLADLPKSKFTIKADTNAKDGRSYADEIAALFNSPKVGWSVKVDNALIMGSNVTGIWITVRDADPDKTPAGAGNLQAAFKAAHMTIGGQFDPSGPPADEFWLSVGLKQ
jgi:hypothetical protein